MSDSWIVLNRTRVQRLLYQIEQYEMSDSLKALPYATIRGIISSAYKEVNRLEGMLKLKDQEIEKLKKYIEYIQPGEEEVVTGEIPPETETPQQKTKKGSKPDLGKRPGER